jgi:hypothetical protein
MTARYVSSTLIKKAMSKNGTIVALECVDKTTAWIRPASYPSRATREDFAEVALQNIEKFKHGTTTIAMKYGHPILIQSRLTKDYRESEHQSDNDQRIHYTAYGLNERNEVIDVQRLVKQK